MVVHSSQLPVRSPVSFEKSCPCCGFVRTSTAMSPVRKHLTINFFTLDVMWYKEMSDLDMSAPLTCWSALVGQPNRALVVLIDHIWLNV